MKWIGVETEAANSSTDSKCQTERGQKRNNTRTQTPTLPSSLRGQRREKVGILVVPVRKAPFGVLANYWLKCSCHKDAMRLTKRHRRFGTL